MWRVKNASAETPPTAATKTSAAAAAVVPPPPPPPDSATVPTHASTAAVVNPRRKFFAPPTAAPASTPAAAPAAAPVTPSVKPGALAYMRARDDGQRPDVASAVLDAYTFPGGDVGRPGNVLCGHKRSNEADNTPGNDVVAKRSKRNTTTTSTTTSKKADVARARGVHNGAPSEKTHQFLWASSLRTPTGEHDNPAVRTSMQAGSELSTSPTYSGGVFNTNCTVAPTRADVTAAPEGLYSPVAAASSIDAHAGAWPQSAHYAPPMSRLTPPATRAEPPPNPIKPLHDGTTAARGVLPGREASEAPAPTLEKRHREPPRSTKSFFNSFL